MREQLLDVIQHSLSVGFLDTVKVVGTDTETNFQSTDNDRTVIFKAQLIKPIKNLIGESGLSSLSILKGYLNYANFKTDDSTITVKTRENNGKTAPEEIIFKDDQGQSAVYRFMSADMVPDQPEFRGANWEVEFSPQRTKISEFSQMASILSSEATYFGVKVVDKELRFHIGDEDSSTNRSLLKMAIGIDGTLKGDLYWPIQQVLSICKLGLDENLSLHFTSKGALKISMESTHANYDYYLPARRK